MGKLKEVADDLSDNQELEAEGAGEKISAQFRKRSAKLKKYWRNRHAVSRLKVRQVTRSGSAVPKLVGRPTWPWVVSPP